MKNLISTLFFSGFILLNLSLQAQDLGNLIPKAHYTLINTAEDALGIQQPIELVNAPFDGNDGIYLNGIYIASGNPDAGWAHTPFVEALYDSVFAVQLQFRIEEIVPSVYLPVVVIGDGWRYLGLEVRWDSAFLLLLNNGIVELSELIKAEENRWYEATIIYDQEADQVQFYLDGLLIESINAAIDRPESDGNVSNTNGATGRAFKGNWRNLKIFGSDPISKIDEDFYLSSHLLLSPNPVSDKLRMNYTGTNKYKWSIHDFRGIPVKEGLELSSTHEVDFRSVPAGIYIFNVMDENANIIYRKEIIKGM